MSAVEPTPRGWTVEEYHRAADAGVFRPEERLELIEGEIFRMSPQNKPHMAGILLTQAVLQKLFPAGWVLLVQMPLTLDGESEPEPDLALVPGEPRDLVQGPMKMAMLVVEVADTSLRHDRNKAGPYARAGIPEYWILNLPERRLEVHRDPDPVAERYQKTTHLEESDATSLLAAPDASIAVRDLLP
jgi:Uma2 family endonuclease